MLVMHNYAVNNKLKCMQYQLARVIAVPFARIKISHKIYWNWYIWLDYRS